MSNPVIRAAVASEQRLLEELQLRASLTNARDRDTLLANPDAIELPLEQITAGRVFVAELHGAIVGFSAILPRADGGTELDGLFVDPGCRRRGIGRLLVEYSADVARNQGSDALHVIGNPHAKDFYKACNFKMTGTSQTRFGVGLQLRRAL